MSRSGLPVPRRRQVQWRRGGGQRIERDGLGGSCDSALATGKQLVIHDGHGRYEGFKDCRAARRPRWSSFDSSARRSPPHPIFVRGRRRGPPAPSAVARGDELPALVAHNFGNTANPRCDHGTAAGERLQNNIGAAFHVTWQGDQIRGGHPNRYLVKTARGQHMDVAAGVAGLNQAFDEGSVRPFANQIRVQIGPLAGGAQSPPRLVPQTFLTSIRPI